ncbi:MAG TPA: hypothetical protein VMS95_05975, partial [Candidatus Krumholzibacteriaceae bacterium]|nr:hypothetical protein [Candidatus Krumholzibacteriaceae bacterium]
MTFDFGSYVPFNVTSGSLLPYEESATFKIVNITTTGDWKLNLTQGTVVEFLLPEGTLPYRSNDYTIGYESGRYTVKFINASSEFTSGTWKINFYNVRLYNFFFIEMASVIFLAAILVIMVMLHFGWIGILLNKTHLGKAIRKRTSKFHLGDTARKLILAFLSGVAGPTLILFELTIIGDWFTDLVTKKLIFTGLLILQGVLAATEFILVKNWK